MDDRTYRYDAGLEGAAPGYVQLGLDDAYQASKGYGWTTPPETHFSRKSLNRFREESLLDGVTGSSVAFRADVPPGTWWVSLWMEAGMEDSNTATLTLNGSPSPIAWFAFDEATEPRTSIQKIYRFFHKQVRKAHTHYSFYETISHS
jgi:hypothetical protein